MARGVQSVPSMTSPAAPHVPPFCPAPDCPFHTSPGPDWRWVRTGFFHRKRPPRIVQRYRCSHCRRSFSDQTFRIGYWLKRPELLVPIFHRLVGCSAFRQIAREFEVSPSTVATHAARLGRHCLLFHWRERPPGPIRERLVLDGFESFEWSQYHPTSYHLLAGAESHYLYGFTDSERRRSGRMSAGQQRRRQALESRLGRPDPRSVEREVARLLALVAAEPQGLELDSDEHQDYPRALRRLGHLTVDHRVTSSRAPRTSRNPLFAVNLADLLIRHSGANHKRETIAFSKRRQSGAERLWVFLVWRNWGKWFSERRRSWTPAMRLGLTGHRWRVEQLLKERLFPSRVVLPERWRRYYGRDVTTRAILQCRRHRLRYAA
jgi:transposase-like protein